MALNNKKFSVLFALGLLCVLGPVAQAQTISDIKLSANNDGSPASDLSVSINGQRKTVTDKAFKAWIVDSGRVVLWAGPDGAGGFENEGQSLWSYDTKSGQKHRLAAEYFMIDTVREAKSTSGKTAYVLSMNDGGLGGPHLAVVDPTRGLVWRQQMGRLTAIRNGRLAIGLVTEDAVSNATSRLPAISKMIYVDIDLLLKRKVIVLPHMG